MSGATRSSIEVAIRVRPMRPEIHETKLAWNFTPTTARELANPDTFFTFDHIYDTGASTQHLYERSVRESIVRRVAQGYNGTVFAYGQTGSGKTFTMFGDINSRSRRSAGLIELAVEDLFVALEQERQLAMGSPRRTTVAALHHSNGGIASSTSNASGRMKGYEVFVSELEIYNEQLRDLLLPQGQPAKPLSIRENEHGVYVHHATRVKVGTATECLRVIYKHAESRVSASTAMNDYSSRSHCIIQIHVEKTLYVDEDSDSDDNDVDGNGEEDGGNYSNTEDDDPTSITSRGTATSSSTGGDGAVRRQAKVDKAKRPDKKRLVSLLNLVDLAGSERVAKTGAVGLRMVEGGHINKSLTALTTVINRLAEINNSGAAFVPYRDSRLTHLLKTSIGGNAFTCMFCCVTPALENVDESRSTLQFASRAKKIKNRVSLNEVMHPRARVRELEVEVRRVRRQLVAQTLYLWSKQVTIKHLQDKLDVLVGNGGAADGGSDEFGHQHQQRQLSSSSFAASALAQRRAGPDVQRQLIVEQLQARNEALEEELGNLKASIAAGGGASSTTTGQLPEMASTADVAQLQVDVSDLEAMLSEMEQEKLAAEQRAKEAQHACRQLEATQARLKQQAKQLEERCKEAEGLLDDLDDERSAAVADAELLRTQLQKTQSKLLEKSRGDAYLEELTQLHIAHQELQFQHGQLKDGAQKQVRDLQAQLTAVRQEQEDLEDEKEEVRDQGRQLNAYLRRFLAVASLASKGRVDLGDDDDDDDDDNDETEEEGDPRADQQIPERRIVAAIESLTKAVSVSRVAGKDTTEDNHNNSSNRSSATLWTKPSPQSSQSQSPSSVAGLRARVRELEVLLINKDAQRDVLIDTKLKRMQELVLRLHAVNGALVKEMEQCYSDNDELFRMMQKRTKLVSKLSKAGLYPRSLQSALERARFAAPAEKPLGHN